MILSKKKHKKGKMSSINIKLRENQGVGLMAETSEIDRIAQRAADDYQKAHPGVTLDDAARQKIREATKQAFNETGSVTAGVATTAAAVDGGVNGVILRSVAKEGLTSMFKGVAGWVGMPLAIGFSGWDAVSEYKKDNRAGVGQALGGLAGTLAATGGLILVAGTSAPILAVAVVGGAGYLAGRWAGKEIAQATGPEGSLRRAFGGPASGAALQKTGAENQAAGMHASTDMNDKPKL